MLTPAKFVVKAAYGYARQQTLKSRVERAGRSVDPSSLLTADIVLSTTDAAISKAIRVGTGSPVSHGMLYIGDGQVVEAIGEGVVMRSLGLALRDAIRAAVYRKSDLTETQALMVRDYVGNQVGKPYDAVGALLSPDPVLCHVPGAPEKFFCSELVLAAFDHAGASLTDRRPSCGTPDTLLSAYFSGTTQYVGHLVADL